MRRFVRYPCKTLHQLTSSVGSQNRHVYNCKPPALFISETSTNSFMNIQRHLTNIHSFKVNDFSSRAVTLSNAVNNFQTKVHKSHHLRADPCTYRGIHSQRKNSSYQITQNNKDRLLEITSNEQALKVPFIWLRDHCRSEKYYNHKANEKIIDSGLLKTNLTPASVDYSGNNLGVEIVWKDGHVSEFTFEFLLDNFYPGHLCHRTERLLWNRAIIESNGLPEVSYDRYMREESVLKQSLENLVRYGFTFVHCVPVSMDRTQEVAERVASVVTTFFGKMCVVTADGSHNDTAYSTQYLGAHTDNSYLISPAGIQVFHCLEHNGAGGESLLVDGFNVIELLRTRDPAAFHLLNQTPIPHEYIENPIEDSPKHHFYTPGTVISTYPSSGELLQIRYNPYHRAPLNTVKPDHIPAFYEAYDKLSKLITDPSNELWVKLNPGTVLLIDNWRVMHGRAGFDGKRILSTCYMSRDEWLSKAKLMGVL